MTETGETFQVRPMQAHTTKAKQLIIDGLPMHAIALHVGYSTASAFGRAFKSARVSPRVPISTSTLALAYGFDRFSGSPPAGHAMYPGTGWSRTRGHE